MAASFVPPHPISSSDRVGRGGGRSRSVGASSSATGWSASDARRIEATRRMYLQRRLGVLLATVVVVVLASLLLFGNGGVAADLDANAPVQTYRVRSGDTLWSIAESLEVDGDRRGIVEALADANGGGEIRAGEDLIIPASLGSVR